MKNIPSQFTWKMKRSLINTYITRFLWFFFFFGLLKKWKEPKMWWKNAITTVMSMHARVQKGKPYLLILLFVEIKFEKKSIKKEMGAIFSHFWLILVVYHVCDKSNGVDMHIWYKYKLIANKILIVLLNQKHSRS